MKRFEKYFVVELRRGGALGSTRGSEVKKAGGQANIVMLNLVQHLLYRRLEDKRVGRYAIIGERSSQKIIFPLPGELTFVGERENFLANTSEHRNSGEGYNFNLTLPLYSPCLTRFAINGHGSAFTLCKAGVPLKGGEYPTVILNLVQELINGRLADRKVRRYAIIGGQSPRNGKTCHCEGVKRPSQSHNCDVLPIIKPHPCPLLVKERGKNKFLPFIGKVRMGFKQPHPSLIREGENNSPKRAYRLKQHHPNPLPREGQFAGERG